MTLDVVEYAPAKITAILNSDLDKEDKRKELHELADKLRKEWKSRNLNVIEHYCFSFVYLVYPAMTYPDAKIFMKYLKVLEAIWEAIYKLFPKEMLD